MKLYTYNLFLESSQKVLYRKNEGVNGIHPEEATAELLKRKKEISERIVPLHPDVEKAIEHVGKQIEESKKQKKIQREQEMEEEQNRERHAAETRIKHATQKSSPTTAELPMNESQKSWRKAAEMQLGDLSKISQDKLRSLISARYPGFEMGRNGLIEKQPLLPWKRKQSQEPIFLALQDELQRRMIHQEPAKIDQISSAQKEKKEQPNTTTITGTNGQEITITSAKRKKESIWEKAKKIFQR